MSRIKYPSAEAKRQALELQAQWEQLKSKKYTAKSMIKESKSAPRRVFKTDHCSPTMGTSRVTPTSIPSRVTGGGSTAAKPAQVYTGDQMIGIAVLHKSCLQPLFNQEAAVEVASMRR